MYALLLLTLLSLPQTCKQEWNRNPYQHGQSQKGISHTQTLRWFHGFGNKPAIESAEYQQYDPRNDFLYRGYLVATILGVFGGIIGLIFLYKQFVATKVAADAAKQSADAAMKNAAVLIASQRAQITLKPHGNPPKDIFDPKGHRLQIELENMGHVPAFDLTYETWIEVLPFPFVDFTEAADYVDMTEKKCLYPRHSPIVVNIPIKKHIDHPLSPQLQERIRANEMYVCVRVSVKYRDPFSDNRYANFGIYVMANGFAFLPKYNDSN